MTINNVVNEAIKELKIELERIDRAIVAAEVMGAGRSRRGRPPKWVARARNSATVETAGSKRLRATSSSLRTEQAAGRSPKAQREPRAWS